MGERPFKGHTSLAGTINVGEKVKAISLPCTNYQCTMFLKDDCFWANDEYVETYTYMQSTTVAFTMEAPTKSP